MDVSELGNNSDDQDKNIAAFSLTLDQVIADLSDVEGMIIDIRYNGGGDDFVSQMIASRFIDKELHAYSKQARLVDSRTPLQDIMLTPSGDTQYLGPVAVLVSTETSSAAEILAMTMRERANTVLVGEATGGGFSDILFKSLPHGLTFGLSNEFYVTPSGEEFEGTGVPVNIEQDFFTHEQLEADEDLGFDKAVAWLLAQ